MATKYYKIEMTPKIVKVTKFDEDEHSEEDVPDWFIDNVNLDGSDFTATEVPKATADLEIDASEGVAV